jgi:hypothetical protein
MGAPVEAPTGVVFVFDLLGVLASITTAVLCLTLATVLFRRRSDDWMVVFISSYLLAYVSGECCLFAVHLPRPHRS